MTTTATASKTNQYVILSKSFFYGPSEGKWEPWMDEQGEVAIFDNATKAAQYVAGPVYLGHNEYSRTYRVHRVRDGKTARDIEHDHQYGRVVTGGSIYPKPVKMEL